MRKNQINNMYKILKNIPKFLKNPLKMYFKIRLKSVKNSQNFTFPHAF